MNISTSGKTVIITGNIKSIQDYQEIKSTIDNLSEKQQNITINLVDSISIISSVIGYLNKLVLKDKINIQIKVGNPQLLELFDDLNLIDLFQVSKV
jgi:hypothetical protein